MEIKLIVLFKVQSYGRFKTEVNAYLLLFLVRPQVLIKMVSL